MSLLCANYYFSEIVSTTRQTTKGRKTLGTTNVYVVEILRHSLPLNDRKTLIITFKSYRNVVISKIGWAIKTVSA